MNKVWRVIKSTRRIGKPWLLQKGYWAPMHTRGMCQGIRKKFKAEYEEGHSTKALAEQAKKEWETK